MPEGPEIRLAADKLQAVLQDNPVTVSFGLPKLSRYDEVILKGKQIFRILLVRWHCGFGWIIAYRVGSVAEKVGLRLQASRCLRTKSRLRCYQFPHQTRLPRSASEESRWKQSAVARATYPELNSWWLSNGSASEA